MIFFGTIINAINKKSVLFEKKAVNVTSQLFGLGISLIVVEVATVEFLEIDLEIFISFTGPDGLVKGQLFDSHSFINLGDGRGTILLKYLNSR